ncbi:unnamed protein product [Brassica rapa]|uniref:Uncharacterized protein n=1 Tax=Brassica campestris TaxID=3711 RepID=A0A8D9FY00_BRACM|nr:unnamed protein product [Brassica rapa]
MTMKSTGSDIDLNVNPVEEDCRTTNGVFVVKRNNQGQEEKSQVSRHFMISFYHVGPNPAFYFTGRSFICLNSSYVFSHCIYYGSYENTHALL